MKKMKIFALLSRSPILSLLGLYPTALKQIYACYQLHPELIPNKYIFWQLRLKSRLLGNVRVMVFAKFSSNVFPICLAYVGCFLSMVSQSDLSRRLLIAHRFQIRTDLGPLVPGGDQKTSGCWCW